MMETDVDFKTSTWDRETRTIMTTVDLLHNVMTEIDLVKNQYHSDISSTSSAENRTDTDRWEM